MLDATHYPAHKYGGFSDSEKEIILHFCKSLGGRARLSTPGFVELCLKHGMNPEQANKYLYTPQAVMRMNELLRENVSNPLSTAVTTTAVDNDNQNQKEPSLKRPNMSSSGRVIYKSAKYASGEDAATSAGIPNANGDTHLRQGSVPPPPSPPKPQAQAQSSTSVVVVPVAPVSKVLPAPTPVPVPAPAPKEPVPGMTVEVRQALDLSEKMNRLLAKRVRLQKSLASVNDTIQQITRFLSESELIE